MNPSILDPAGPGANRIEDLWWLLFWIAVAVFAVVISLMVVAVLRKNEDADTRGEPCWGERLIAIGGVAIPVVILTFVFVVSLSDIKFLSAAPPADALRVDVEGRLWWWEVRYPGTGAVTANEIHIPAGEPVVLRLTTDDVIHSVWIPQLQAKTDMIPGRVNEMTIEADAPGTYRGQCAEFCGLQHARMAFFVVAHSPDDFELWLANEADERRAPTTREQQQGEEVFLTSTCVGCHAIRGTRAAADRGPDLTHIGTREYIAAGTVRRERSLAKFLLFPQTYKPGIKMPPTTFAPGELEALVAYLESLQ